MITRFKVSKIISFILTTPSNKNQPVGTVRKVIDMIDVIFMIYLK
jgi:hypothetical protein